MNPLILLSAATGSVAPPTGITIGNSYGSSPITPNSYETHGNYAYVYSSVGAATATPISYQWYISLNAGGYWFTPAGYGSPPFLPGQSSGAGLVSTDHGTVSPGGSVAIAFNGLPYTSDQINNFTPYYFKVVYSNPGGTTTSPIATKDVRAKIAGSLLSGQYSLANTNSMMIVEVNGSAPMSWEWQYAPSGGVDGNGNGITTENWVPVSTYSTYSLNYSGNNQYITTGSSTSTPFGAINYRSGYGSSYISAMYLFMETKTVASASNGSRYRCIVTNAAAQWGFQPGGQNGSFQLYGPNS